MKNIILILLMSLLSLFCYAEEDRSQTKLKNFSEVYLGTAIFYYFSQQEDIHDYGSWENWRTNPFKTHYDKDSYDYNVLKHSFAGAGYFLYYRARGYTRPEAYGYAFLSSLAFEFTIETYTEPPSYQDIFQTPTFGTILGVGLENMSDYFLSKNHWSAKLLGTILNPFSLLKDNRSFLVWNSDFKGKTSVAVGMEF